MSVCGGGGGVWVGGVVEGNRVMMKGVMEEGGMFVGVMLRA